MAQQQDRHYRYAAEEEWANFWTVQNLDVEADLKDWVENTMGPDPAKRMSLEKMGEHPLVTRDVGDDDEVCAYFINLN